jgi:(1->4)-alpha-D-glucan 1-alpha-D-glucosylmutase
MSVPRATMRLQLHRGFTFDDATELVPYLAALGISHLYSSPVLTASPGSTHGYDVTDPTQVNPELGGEDGLRRLVVALRGSGLGLIVDIVPNHMAAGGMTNPWWTDVLRHGQNSRFAKFFDMDWHGGDPSLQGKMLVPFLGEPYGDALRSGAIVVERTGAFPMIRYHGLRFPIRSEDHAEIAMAELDAFDPATQTGRGRLHRLLERQHYRLAWWRSAGDSINWRRFFDINGLAGLRVEDNEVFEATHATLLRLYGEGLIDGLRIDHVDGLADPPGYCRRLRAKLDALASCRPSDAPAGPAWLVVEKILGADERLPGDWGVDGTSGYDFMDQVCALLHDKAGENSLRAFWASTSGRPADFGEEEIAARRDVLVRAFSAQLETAVTALHRVALSRIDTRDTTPAAIRRALVAILMHFRVYRSYGIGPSSVLAQAVADAMKHSRAADHAAIELVHQWLNDETIRDVSVHFQQLSAPLAAKAVEDTAYYRYGVLLSRNEVGADVHRFSATAQEFHAASLARREAFPAAMLATATHDHKRGEDVRARLAVLTEIPEEWEGAVRRWFRANAPHRRVGCMPMPSPGDEAMLYQMIVGAWPIELDATNADAVRDYTERLAGWQLKALREAKLATDWVEPNTTYEEAVRAFLEAIMADGQGFVADAAAFAHRIGPAGAVNGLAQTLLKLTAPGVPDFYQGTEFWDQSLVDPDNRRPVDFSPRIAALKSDQTPVALAAQWRDGRVKQAMIRRVLALRSQHQELFADGEYRPIDVTGPLAEHVIAFARSLAGDSCIVAVPRLTTALLAGDDMITLRQDAWQGTKLHLPCDLSRSRMRNVFDGACIELSEGIVPLSDVTTAFPLALLV